MNSDQKTNHQSPIILIADDDCFTANIFRNQLTKDGYEVYVATNGQEAIDMAKSNIPNLLLLDLIMPIKDGFEVISEIKSEPLLKNLKIVILSNLGQEEDVEKARALGVDGYLIKNSLSLQVIKEKVSKFVVGGK